MEHTARIFDAVKESVSSCVSDGLAFSGGLDSSIIAHFLKERRPDAVSVIADDFPASDLKYCRLAAEHFGIPLHVERASTGVLLDAVESTVRILENFNDMEIRNSVVLYVAMSRLQERGRGGIITGDGADELFAGYGFFLRMKPGEIEARQKKIWKNMRFASHKIGKDLGIRVESPFLSKGIKDIARAIPADLKVGEHGGKKHGKFILRRAFEGVMPESIAWRPKSAMQDGAGTAGLTGHFEGTISDSVFAEKRGLIARSDGVRIRTKESLYYYEIYRGIFGAPAKSGGNPCPYCMGAITDGAAFCRRCGAYPV